jgi:hypothetical protein
MGRRSINIGRSVIVRVGKSEQTDVLDRNGIRYSLYEAEICTFEPVSPRVMRKYGYGVQIRYDKARVAFKVVGGKAILPAIGMEFDARIAGAVIGNPQPYPLRKRTAFLLSHIEPVGAQHRRNEEIRRRPSQRGRSRVHTQEF